MKYIKIIAVFFSLVVFSGCTDEVEETQDYKQLLVGKWHYLGYQNYTGFSYHTDPCPAKKNYIEFFANGEADVINYGTACEPLVGDYAANWNIDDGRMVLINFVEPYMGNRKYIIVSINDKEFIGKTHIGYSAATEEPIYRYTIFYKQP